MEIYIICSLVIEFNTITSNYNWRSYKNNSLVFLATYILIIDEIKRMILIKNEMTKSKFRNYWLKQLWFSVGRMYLVSSYSGTS